MTDVQRLLDALTAAGVEFVVAGGVALVLRGSSRVTIDLDLCYARDRETCAGSLLLSPRSIRACAGRRQIFPSCGTNTR